ncbi:hypothetical protein GOP47_0002377 [Adiantum capillus-veneris]|uniref:Uncharacterized protein n=1 Tax=Adiantum capillus-veneris TaxID=13818 RepID=A0A9D4VA92_ADICA|nr:hypothetical protein GOP47_0002377 [Adiantum capillus-veneris]
MRGSGGRKLEAGRAGEQGHRPHRWMSKITTINLRKFSLGDLAAGDLEPYRAALFVFAADHEQAGLGEAHGFAKLVKAFRIGQAVPPLAHHPHSRHAPQRKLCEAHLQNLIWNVLQAL